MRPTPDAPPLAHAIIPSSGERIARVGLGTWATFDAGDDAGRRARLAEVLRVFRDGGATLVDTSPMYGSAEAVLGDLFAAGDLHRRAWIATKVWTTGEDAGERQMTDSLRLLRTDRVELMQVHNLVDWRTQLKTVRRWRDEGRVRYVGITHYKRSDFDDGARVLRAEPLDFVQLNLSLDEPHAAERMLDLCAERRVAFIANRPFGGGSSFGRTHGRALPGWCADLGITSWAQYQVKWILSHPQVTVAIPATGNPAHAADILGGARGAMPDAQMRAQMAAHWRTL